MSDFEVRSALGTLLYTSSERDLALRWARTRRDIYPGLKVQAVQRVEHRQTLWSDRSYLKLVGAA